MCPPVLISRTARNMLLILQHEVNMQINTINQACPVELRKHQYNKQTEDNMDLLFVHCFETFCIDKQIKLDDKMKQIKPPLRIFCALRGMPLHLSETNITLQV